MDGVTRASASEVAAFKRVADRLYEKFWRHRDTERDVMVRSHEWELTELSSEELRGFWVTTLDMQGVSDDWLALARRDPRSVAAIHGMRCEVRELGKAGKVSVDIDPQALGSFIWRWTYRFLPNDGGSPVRTGTSGVSSPRGKGATRITRAYGDVWIWCAS